MRVVWISDLDPKGSGYFNLSIPLCEGLVNSGHEVKAIGLGYRGQEHDYNFSIIPASNIQETVGIMQNLTNLWKFDFLIIALDIPLQEIIMQRVPKPKPFKYIGIMPIEADPLCMSWAMVLAAMDKALIISEFGTEEAHKAGIMSAEHLRVGIDTEAWRSPTQEERTSIRQSMGIAEDCFVVLTVADNQERKNLSKSMEMFAEFSKDKPNTKYVLVTREHNQVGWKLRDYAQVLGIHQKIMIFERGMAFKELWSIYAISDCFLLASKTEGLGMPIMEAMSMGIPCISTNCSGAKELLSEGRGFLMDYDYTHVDPFGNGHRYWAKNEIGVYYLQALYDNRLTPNLEKARTYTEGRTWDQAISKLDSVLNEMRRSSEPIII